MSRAATLTPAAPATARRGARRAGVRAARWLLVLIVLAAVLPRATIWVLARGQVAHSPADLPKLQEGDRRAAIVLGAGLVNDRPSAILAARVKAATDLLDAERVDLLIVSGDNTTEYYDEPTAMRQEAIDLGAPADQVAADYAGRRTWDTCRRAHDIFGIRDAVVVTSSFHVDRAIATCRAAGINTRGYSVSDAEHRVTNRARWRIRELAASGRALVDAWVVRPAPAVGGAPIDPYDPCELNASLAPSVAAGETILPGTCP